MEPYFDLQELSNKLKDFYILTHIRITIFDNSFNEVTSYPTKKAEICSYLRENKAFDLACKKCDKEHMLIASKRKKPLVYTCHAGIYEIISPLVIDDTIVGYLFFSHILNYESYSSAYKTIKLNLSKYQLKCDENKVKELLVKLPLFNDEYLKAAASFLEETALYFITRRLAYMKNEGLAKKIDKYIKDNLSLDLTVSSLCKEFYIGKTTLYSIMSSYYSDSLAHHIKTLRINKAKEMLLENTNLKISTIALQVGFNDYSHFINVFSNEVGVTPKRYRSLNKREDIL